MRRMMLILSAALLAGCDAGEPENQRDGIFDPQLVLRMSERSEGAFDFVVA